MNPVHWLVGWALALVPILYPFSLCIGEERSSVPSSEVTRETKEAVTAAKDYTIQQKNAFEKKAQAELDKLQNQIARLRKKTNQVSASARTELKKTIGELEMKKDAARKKLDELNQAGVGAWNDVKSGWIAAMDELKKSYTEALSKLP